MCNVLKVSRSGYYKWIGRPKSPTQERNDELTKEVRKVFIESRQLYGSPKITMKLNRDGIKVTQKTVSRIMAKEGMRSRTVKKHKATTNSNHTLPVHENTLNQQFSVSKPNEVWVADITYIPTDEGWLYLASVMDLFSRKIVGWHADSTMTKELVLKALRQANLRQQPSGSVLHHSDRGSQYASKDYQSCLLEFNMKSSMSRKGNCYDNACIESYHGVLKKELIYQTHYKTREEAKKDLFEYLEIFYNNKRIHSTLGYYSPSEYEHMYHENNSN